MSMAANEVSKPVDARLLVVEDEPNILELLSASLRYAGFDVITASAGTEAVQAAQRHRPDLIVRDEPTTAMDVETRRRFWSQMKEEVAEGKTLLFATHYLEEADQAADRILVINRGRLLADGTPDDIKKRAGAKRMSFHLDGADESVLLRLPGIVSLETRHDFVQLQTDDSDATLYALLDAGYRPSEVEIGSLGLEQAFLAITAEDDRAGETESAPAR